MEARLKNKERVIATFYLTFLTFSHCCEFTSRTSSFFPQNCEI